MAETYQQYRDRVVPIGAKFGSWTVIDNTVSTKKSRGVLCRCLCGKTKKVYIACWMGNRRRPAA